ncbi:acyl-CoA thioesterase [Herbiconiux sp. KACC 21604]|uniref:acyl-CoA thioesterase n=1 Tax=unclassified Herbiconiux TaxID=2618217 RepID=UPI0014915121|nr:acyl-CoA thioesterase [Herbiconiux sp. SALV-R1]QJU55534.1 thioesterase family protein [Herbiconiux sp. SALV-R1]WPO86719.1 acyl-CoA thioesterase [Herbiconiux sp. KACC 21604]
MHFLLRTLLQSLRSRFRSRLDVWDVSSTPFRVIPTDLDVLRHMNNGVYLSLLDIARLDLMQRSGTWPLLQSWGWYPVVVAETISFRRSLQLWQRFEVESRLLGFDQRSVLMEQRFVVRGEIYARAFIRARFLKRSGGIVPMDELRALVGPAPVGERFPDWAASWAEATQLPSTKAPAESVWE